MDFVTAGEASAQIKRLLKKLGAVAIDRGTGDTDPLEEIIFRGFLFVGMSRKNVHSAIVVSSVTFGIGHIVNLLNGQDLLETLLQIVFAVAVGFALVALFYKGKSLIPCIVFHGVNNALSAVSDEKASLKVFGTAEKELWITVSIAVVIAIVYSVAMWKRLSPEKS